MHGVGVDPLIQRLDQMTTKHFAAAAAGARRTVPFSAGSYQQVLLLDDVVKPLEDELETMLAQRQQRLLLTDVESEAIVSGDATLIRVILAQSGGECSPLQPGRVNYPRVGESGPDAGDGGGR